MLDSLFAIRGDTDQKGQRNAKMIAAYNLDLFFREVGLQQKLYQLFSLLQRLWV